MMRLACALILAWLAAPWPGPSAGQRIAELRRSADGETHRCEAKSATWEAGRQGLEALDERIKGLVDDEPVGPTLDEFAALISIECFRFALESPRVPAPDSGLSLKQWWEDGGHAWLASYLELPELGLTTDLKKHVVVPPDTRRTLRIGAGPPHLAQLLCALDDSTCAADTSGWRTRAESFLSLHSVREQTRERDEQGKNTPFIHATTCAQTAAGAPAELQYTAWRACLESQRPRRWVLPLGRLRAPASGWLIVWGRRGHYSFCEAIGAYHLETGAAYIAESCSNLVLQKEGSIDRGATRRAARSRTVAGRLRLDNLREAAWALLLLKEAENVQAAAEYYALPSGLTPVLVSKKWDAPSSWSGGEWMTTAQTTLQWAWVRELKEPVAAGTLTWPNSSNAVEEHTAGLLQVAEGTLIEGCPPSPPPLDLVQRRIRVNRRDAVPGIDRELFERFRTWRPVPPCDPHRIRPAAR